MLPFVQHGGYHYCLTARRFEVQVSAPAFLCEVCMIFLCMCVQALTLSVIASGSLCVLALR